MQNNNLKSHANLHLIVFIWGFTGVLGALITIKSEYIVWYRMGLAFVILLLYAFFTKKSFKLPKKIILKMSFVGFLIALHWWFFFKAIHISNVSLTLSIFSLGAFFASILEPLFYKRKLVFYEIIFGLITVFGLSLILKAEFKHLTGMILALLSVLFGVLFTLANGQLTKQFESTIIASYEFLFGFLWLSLYLFINQDFNQDFFDMSLKNWFYIFVLASVCSAYAFTTSVKLMQKLSPYTVLLTINLEPVYGIILAYFILGEKEKMSAEFYIGALIIMATIILNAFFKAKTKKNKTL